MFKLETDILRVAVSFAVSEVYNGGDILFETNLRLTATEMIVEAGRAYIVMTKYDHVTSFNVYGYFSDVDLAVNDSNSNKVFEITKLTYGYKVEDISSLFV